MTQGIIKAIGQDAISTKDQMIILFGEQATPELRKVSVIQEIEKTGTPIQLTVGGEISFDGQKYQIEHVGDYAEEQLNTIGHMTLVFKEVPAGDALVNAVYLTPFTLPTLTEGSVITY